jgi:hypothetical protein
MSDGILRRAPIIAGIELEAGADSEPHSALDMLASQL